ncbi:YceD family protein [Maledivibacter halophilus]|uniref:DUF177 domain-containing protein n=1 Tax=Maledivibacter halophilus TaxID=36842 RepID=A0A1T5MGS6_9FIRM|nr:DUF177 domain-containing protein [Maledivibacter halophilus]SKC87144.1 uncharacterized protein SAMN02194393_04651 [Maledivibacter halophilus]
MNINISKLITEKIEYVDINFDFILDDSEFLKDYNIVKSSPIRVLGKIYKESDSIFIDASFSGKAVFQCSRCLKEFKSNISDNIEFYIPISENKVEDDSYINGHLLNLKMVIEEALAFSLPMKVLCSEECKGLCPNCGQNLNIDECNCDIDDIDPRLEKLKHFFNEDEEV